MAIAETAALAREKELETALVHTCFELMKAKHAASKQADAGAEAKTGQTAASKEGNLPQARTVRIVRGCAYSFVSRPVEHTNAL